MLESFPSKDISPLPKQPEPPLVCPQCGASLAEINTNDRHALPEKATTKNISQGKLSVAKVSLFQWLIFINLLIFFSWTVFFSFDDLLNTITAVPPKVTQPISSVILNDDLCLDYVRKGDADKALETCGQLIQKGSLNAAIYSSYGWSLMKLHKENQAIEVLNKAIELDPINAENYAFRGLTYYGKGQFDLAITDYDRAIELESNAAYLYGDRGLAHQKKGQYDLAITDYNKAIQVDPNVAYIYGSRGAAYINKGQLNLAIADYDRAIELEPNAAYLYGDRGLAYHKKGQYDLAIADYDRAIELNSNVVYFYDSRGLAYYKKGRFNLAIDDYNKAIELAPENYRAMLNLSRSYSLAGNADDACKWLQKAIDSGNNYWNEIKRDTAFKRIRNAKCYLAIIAKQ